MGRPSYRCDECDDWKSAPYCPDCGAPCALYVPSGRVRMRAELGPVEPDEDHMSEWQPIETAPAAAKVEALTARGETITGRTMGRGSRGRRGGNMVETADGFRHVCTHWRPTDTNPQEPADE